MKRLILRICVLSILVVSCQKKVDKTENKEETLRYVAEDGSNALVTFGEDKNGNYISIRSNNKTIKVKQQEKTKQGAIYNENTVIVETKGDSLFITQDDFVIGLKKAGGQ